MISLILPYWDRQEAADRALNLLAKHYGRSIEVIVVDDGNRVPFKASDVDLNLRIVRLPTKEKPTPQSKAWNAGVRAATGDLIALSCVEILHTDPVLEELAKEAVGDTYALAAAWCPELNEWQCHSSKPTDFCPRGTGPSFLGVMRKDLFLKAGGFDEDYHEGAGYEDKDFIHRMLAAGAKFVIRDDLIVTHPKTGASIQWGTEGFARNERIFFSKWPLESMNDPVTFLCLKAGTAYGPEYVNILFDMVSRNLPKGTRGKFACLTDDDTGIDSAIKTIPLPDDLETWWGKLYMFKRGLFPDGERIIFMDLDTVIVGGLHEIVKYNGQFATLRDFYFPQRLGPAIIAWEAGSFAASIWEEWVSQGKPRHPMGDLWWLNNLNQGRFPKKIDILQDIFPGKFCSFKVDCHPYPPVGTAVVCFHGEPKPDNCISDWVASVWKIGGAGFAEFETIANTEIAESNHNVVHSCSLGLPWLEIVDPHERHAVIVGGGPSITDTLPEIQWRKELGQTIVALNGSASWLNQHGIIPDIHIIIDSRELNRRFIFASQSHAIYLASQCHPSVFSIADNATIFHMNTAGVEDVLPKDRVAHLISTGTTVGLAAMGVMYCLGYRVIHLHGYDSSYTTDHHGYAQVENDEDAVIDVSVNGQSFKAAPWMVNQAQQFQELSLQLVENGVTITVAGDGLLPYIAHCLSEGV